MARTLPVTSDTGGRNAFKAPFWLAALLPGLVNFKPSEEVLIVRTSQVNDRGHIVSHYTAERKQADFYWPKTGNVSFVGKFDPSDVCGYGLHGCLLYKPNTLPSLVTQNNAVLQVVRVKRSDAFIVTAQGEKAKFCRGEVIMTTNSADDVAELAAAVYGSAYKDAVASGIKRRLTASNLVKNFATVV